MGFTGRRGWDGDPTGAFAVPGEFGRVTGRVAGTRKHPRGMGAAP